MKKNKIEIKRGQLYWIWCDNKGKANHQETGRRPVLILQCDELNNDSNILTTIVLPVTTKIKRQSEYDYLLKYTKLKKQSVILCDNIQLVDIYKIKKDDYIAEIDEKDMLEIEIALCNCLGIKTIKNKEKGN